MSHVRRDSVWSTEKTSKVYTLPLALSPDEATGHKDILGADIPAALLYQTAHLWCVRSPLIHQAAFKNAINFLAPVGTPVRAAGSGTVKELRDYLIRGNGGSDRDRLKCITIQHSETEFTRYCNVKGASPAATVIELGSEVKAGQVIGTVGDAGITGYVHLHFLAFRPNQNPSPLGFKSFAPKWFDS